MKIAPGNTVILSGGTPQPLIGSVTAAAIVGSTAAQTVNMNSTLGVGMLRQADNVWVDTGASAELVNLTGVGNNTISGVFLKNHANGKPVALMQPMTGFGVQGGTGNSGTLYVFYAPNQFAALASYGRQSLAPAISNFVCGLFVIVKVSAVQPNQNSIQNNYGGNPDNSCFLWVDGTTNDVYVPWIDVA